jgi:hypothetical protein
MARISPFTEFVKVGAEADLTVGQDAGQKIWSAGCRNRRGNQPTAKRLLTELQVPNQTCELFPGAYVQVALKIKGSDGDLTIPAETLLFTSGKPA